MWGGGGGKACPETFGARKALAAPNISRPVLSEICPLPYKTVENPGNVLNLPSRT